MKKTSKTTITKTEIVTYHLTKEVVYQITIVNDVETQRALVYRGKNIHNYPVSAVYKEDASLLKYWNPFWGDRTIQDERSNENSGYSWFNDKLPEPEKIDVKKIILAQGASHRFYDLNHNPIPVVFRGDYIEASLSNEHYDIDKLQKHLKSHKNIVFCSEVLNIPSFNAGQNKNLYIEVLVYPEKKWLEELAKFPDRLISRFWYKPYLEEHHNVFDFLKVKKFVKK